MSSNKNIVEIGNKVNDFQAESTGGAFRLSDYEGRMVVLYFYPKDNTPGCSTESADFAAVWKDFLAAGAEVFGVSRDSLTSHTNFKRKLALPFELISDTDEAICRQFDVIKMKNMYGKQSQGVERSTFLINRQGVLVKEWRKVKVTDHVAEVLEAVREAEPKH
ncbi:MAG: peroxiredoxin [Lautropia sp.]|nr:peroxiredoxin [Lautropia sp.]